MLQYPWDVKSDDSRPSDTITTFIIFCEDEVSEPLYFRRYEVQGKVKVNAIENQKQHWHNLTNTINDCVHNGLLEGWNGTYRVKPGTTTQIWSAYDRDMESEQVNAQVQVNDIHFSTAIATAKNIGIKVAWSNDVFELWILLHFEQVPMGQRLHRNYVYDRLTAVFRNLQEKSADLQRITDNPNFNYKTSFKKRTAFLLHVLPQLTASRRIAATARAKQLEAYFANDAPYHSRNPCTSVHHLVQALLESSSGPQQ